MADGSAQIRLTDQLTPTLEPQSEDKVIQVIEAVLKAFNRAYAVDDAQRINISLRDAGDEVVRRGCHGIHMDTMSFQALPLCLKNGFVIFGEIEDIPTGHSRYFLKKRLPNPQ